jgi:GAF domain-containing protein
MKCPRCQHDDRPAAKFCEECGTPFALPKGGGPPAASYEELQHALTEALDQQTAASEVLNAIGQATTDLQPVFDAIVRSASQLCDGQWAAAVRFDGELVHLVAQYNRQPDGPDLGIVFPYPPGRRFPAGRAVAEGRVVHIPDAEKDPDLAPEVARRARSFLVVPMLRAGAPIGAIAVARPAPGPFPSSQIELLRTFAGQAVIALENVRLFTDLQVRNNDLTEALEQQTATSEILQVISRSPTDVQPVFDAIARSAVSLCEGSFAGVDRFDGKLIHRVAQHNIRPQGRDALESAFPMLPSRRLATGRAVLHGRVIHIADVEADLEYDHAISSAVGMRSVLAVPLLRQGVAIGAIGVARDKPTPFSDQQIELLKTFADQAVIAIENVRLFNETKEALERQTATSEILSVISGSPTDVQPTFEAIAASAIRLCAAEEGTVFRFDGTLIHLAAHRGIVQNDLVRRVFPRPAGPGSVTARAILTRSVVHIPDVRADPDLEQSVLITLGFRTVLAVPMLRDGEPIGAITVSRQTVAPFSDAQIVLLQTFADQAVIAIENVRLFTALQERNQALTQAHAQVTQTLDQQTAASEILKVISRSPTEVQPVFDTIVRNAARLCQAATATVLRTDGTMLYVPANYGASPDVLAAARVLFPRPLDMTTASGAAILTRSVIQIPDSEDPAASEFVRRAGRLLGYRSSLAVPMLRGAEAIGAIRVTRREASRFSDADVELLRTFADQAVIAIENVRLFKELEARNQDLTAALEQQTATSEILRVISQSPTDVQPVFDAIVRSASHLCGGEYAIVTRYDGEFLRLAAQYNARPGLANVTERFFPRRPGRDLPSGRAILDRAAAHIPDTAEDRDLGPDVAGIAGSYLSVPMVRDGVPVGAIGVSRATVGPFAPEQIALLQTFADQAVIAIENVRLFTELQARNRDLTEALDRQTATAEVLRVISQSQTEVQPVFDAIVDNAMRLFRAWSATITQSDGQFIHLIATRGGLPGSAEYMRGQSPWPIHEAGVLARCFADRAVIQIRDIESDPTQAPVTRDLARVRGWRSLLGAPMLRDGLPIGAITINRAEAGTFSPAEIELLQTFAAQAVIAVENTRLLAELQARTGELMRSVGELTALGDVSRALSSTLDLDAILQTIVTRANQLAGTDACSVFEYDETTEAFHLRATNNLDEEVITLARQTPTRKGEGVQGRMAVTRQPVQIPDIAEEDAYHGPLRDILLRTGTRAILAIPMLREDQLIGGLTVNKKTPGEFPPEVVELLKTFATQSALAIQNARLFREIEQKSRELEAASRHKSEFLANMSHELRTPLNAIIGFSEVLSERMFGELNAKQEEYLKDIHASGQHLLSLINDILDLSKIEAGRMELELTDFHLPTALDNALTLVRERAGRRGIALHMTSDERLDYVRADERKVRQVVLNLLSNAIKFTPEGGRIEVRAKPVDGSVEVSVTDTGVGIAPEDQEAIFEEFRQVGTADKKVEGTGLGLTLCRKFVELHGGRIWVKSRVDVGSTFTFTIPVR